jgi:hypothetical protein
MIFDPSTPLIAIELIGTSIAVLLLVLAAGSK